MLHLRRSLHQNADINRLLALGAFIETDLCLLKIPRLPLSDSTLSQEVKTVALQGWGLDLDSAKLSVLGNKTVQSYCILAELPGKNQVFRKCLMQRNEAYLEKTGLALDYIKSQQAPIINPVASQNGRFVESHAGHLWVCSEFFDAPKYFSGSELEMSLAGEALGRLHTGLEKMPQSITCEFDPEKGAYQQPALSETSLREIRQNLLRLPESAEKVKTIFERELPTIELAVKVRDSLKRDLKVPSGHLTILHFDLHPHNFLYSEHQGLRILDFDNLRWGFAEVDLGFALHRLGRQAGYWHGMDSIGSSCNEFISSYCKNHRDYVFYPKTVLMHCLDRSLLGVAGVLGRMAKGEACEPIDDSKFEKFAVTPREIFRIFSATNWIADFNQDCLNLRF